FVGILDRLVVGVESRLFAGVACQAQDGLIVIVLRLRIVIRLFASRQVVGLRGGEGESGGVFGLLKIGIALGEDVLLLVASEIELVALPARGLIAGPRRVGIQFAECFLFP